MGIQDKEFENKLHYWLGVASVPLVPVLMLVVLLPAILARAWVATKLWARYVVPLFGAPHLLMSYAYGLQLVVGIFFSRPIEKPNPELKYPWWGATLLAVGLPFVVLAFGWVGTWFLP